MKEIKRWLLFKERAYFYYICSESLIVFTLILFYFMDNSGGAKLKHAINYGVTVGIVLVIISLLFYMIGEAESRIQNYLGYLVLILGIFFGVKAYRDTELNGLISYGNALGTGTLISVVSAIITGLYLMVFITIIDPDFITSLLEKTESDMEDAGSTQEEIKIGMYYTKMFVTPLGLSIMSIIGSIFMGFILSLITGIFLKKTDDSFDANFE